MRGTTDRIYSDRRQATYEDILDAKATLRRDREELKFFQEHGRTDLWTQALIAYTHHIGVYLDQCDRLKKGKQDAKTDSGR